MSKEIIINADKNQTRIALIEDGELAELHIESTDNERTLGDIYMGRVRRTMPSIQAAFIDIGQKQDAFLHYSDLADNLPQWLDYLQKEKPDVSQVALEVDDLPRVARGRSRRSSGNRQGRGRHDRGEKAGKSDVVAAEPGDAEQNAERNGKSSKSKSGSESKAAAPRVNTKPPEAYLDKGKRILVKIVKEPISAKGSRVSTDISLAGRFLVLVPLANYVAVSKKIFSYKERRRLRALARSLLPAGFGVIVRTVAENKKAKELDTDLRLLLDKWRKLEKRLEGKPEGPTKVHEDVSMASSVIRDLFSDDYDRILIDEPKLFKNVKNYVQAVAPHMAPAVHFHKGKNHIFKETKIAHDVKQAFESRVDLPSGGYLFIEHTEAMHVVDVNSGRAGRGLSQEHNSLKVDVEAVHAITKQIRLRDLGGIIVIDFIDLREERNRKKVYFELKKAFARDRAVTKILPMSDFGLVEITRQRLRPSITKTFSNTPDGDEKEGVALRKPQRRERPARSVTIEGFIEKIERWITSYKTKGKGRVVTLEVHPFAAAFLTQKIPAYTTRWFLKYFIRVKLKIDETLDPLGFRFINPKTGEEFVRRSADRRGRGRNNAGRKGSERKGAERSGTGRKSGEKNSSGRSTAADSESVKGNPSSDERRKSSSKRSDSRRGSSSRSDSGRSNTNRNSSGRGNTSRRDADRSAPASNDAEVSNSERDDTKKDDARKDDTRRSSSGRSSSGRGSSSRGSSGRSSSGRGNSNRSNSSRSTPRDNPRSDNPKSDSPKGEPVKGEEKAAKDHRARTDREKPDDK